MCSLVRLVASKSSNKWIKLLKILGKNQKIECNPSGSKRANNGKHTRKDIGTYATKERARLYLTKTKLSLHKYAESH